MCWDFFFQKKKVYSLISKRSKYTYIADICFYINGPKPTVCSEELKKCEQRLVSPKKRNNSRDPQYVTNCVFQNVLTFNPQEKRKDQETYLSDSCDSMRPIYRNIRPLGREIPSKSLSTISLPSGTWTARLANWSADMSSSLWMCVRVVWCILHRESLGWPHPFLLRDIHLLIDRWEPSNDYLGITKNSHLSDFDFPGNFK